MAPKTKKLFISYRSTDAATVDDAARVLAAATYPDGEPRYIPWQDKHNLPPAVPYWWDAILNEIEDCHVFVFFMSKDSLGSAVCLAELDYAYKRNRVIVPVVLEFSTNPSSKKHYITYPELVPNWLNDVQWLFYNPFDFLLQFQAAIDNRERNWPQDTPARRPLEPDVNNSQRNNHVLYNDACDYAKKLLFDKADEIFRTFVRRNDRDYGAVASEWLQLLHEYRELIEISRFANTRFKFENRWKEYLKFFPKRFVEGVFDPKNLAAQLAPQSSLPQAAEESQPNLQSRYKTAKPRSTDLLPQPFAWIEIPGSNGTIKTNDLTVVLDIPTETYWMSKYPVINAQYAKFIDAGGYHERRWWTDAGWETKLKGPEWSNAQSNWIETNRAWTQPRHWQDANLNEAENPVVGVSWYEAVAFCLWLSDVTGENIMLPTEAHWQYAAQGKDGRKYPWGNTWNLGRCNTKESNIGKTTPVRQYEGKGDSPFGVVDMAGNVWEWCLTDYDSHTNDLNRRMTSGGVLRGGSWNQKLNTADVSCRGRNNLYTRFYDYGFRVVLSSNSFKN